MGGHRLRELGLARRFELHAPGLTRGAESHGCETGEVALSADDKLLLLGRRADLRRFADSF